MTIDTLNPTNPLLKVTSNPGNLSDNQLHSIFNSQIGRDATPYELSTNRGTSISKLANLADTHAKLNTNSSITDYLTSVGQDPSLANRTALATKYNIANPGTTTGNLALLNALKSGQPPVAPVALPGSIGGTGVNSQGSNQTYNPQNGTTSIVNPDGTVTTNIDNSQGTGGTTSVVPDGSQTVDNSSPTLPGSISDASGTDNSNQSSDPNQPPVLPTVAPALNDYQTAQKAVADARSQITDINNQIAASLANKIKDINASGGIVDESQLRSTVLTENAPLIAERNNLQTTLSGLISNQSIAGKAYQEALTAQKESDANFYKGATLGINKTKLSDAEQKQSDSIDLSLQKLGVTQNQNLIKEMITGIQNGSLNLPKIQLSALEKNMGLPNGFLSSMSKKPATTVAPVTTTTESPSWLGGIFGGTKTTTKTGIYPLQIVTNSDGSQTTYITTDGINYNPQ